jgi:hypothetical protein
MRDARVEWTPYFIRVPNATNAKEGLCYFDSRVPWGMQCPPDKSCDKRAGGVGEHLRGGAVARQGEIVSILKLGLAWLACACSAGAEEVEGDEDYARGT